MQARYYDPVIGRFYSNDPIGVRDIHSFNRYVYANNNPYKYLDPNGMASEPSWTRFDSTFEGFRNFSSISPSQQHSLENLGITVIKEGEINGFKTTIAKATSTIFGYGRSFRSTVISVSASMVDLYQTGTFSGLGSNAGSKLSERLMEQNKIKSSWIRSIFAISTGTIFGAGVSDYEESENKDTKKSIKKPNETPDGRIKDPWEEASDRIDYW